MGAGFHPDFTGLENIFLYGAVMGLKKKQIMEKIEKIIDFAGLHKFINQPVKHYSSGMYVRLAFSIAVEVDPDILLIDEVLAVGDADFQKKCLEKINDFKRRGKTMLIISHDLRTIQSVSDRILLLENGKLLGIGNPLQVVEQYETLARDKRTNNLRREWGTGEVILTNIKIYSQEGNPSQKFKHGEKILIEINYNAKKKIENPVFGFSISSIDGHLIYGNNTQIENYVIPSIEGNGTVYLSIEELRMSSGIYLFSTSVHSSDHKVNYHRLDNFISFEIVADKAFEGYCFMPCKWEIKDV